MTDSAQKVYKDLVDVLVAKKLISQEKADEINTQELNTGEFEEEIINKMNLVSELELVKAKADYYNIPFINLEEVGVSTEALELVPKVVAQKYKVYPYKIDNKNKILYISMANPIDLETVDFLEKKSGYKIKTAISLPKQIEIYANEKYERDKVITSEVNKALDEREKDIKKFGIITETKVTSEAPIAKIVSTILEYAVRSRASDIHIEPEEEKVRVRYRIDGILQEKYMLPRNVTDAVVSRIKILSNLKIDEKRVPQDGRFFFSTEGKDVDLRVSSLPTTYGEKIVMRLLQKSLKVPSLPELGLRGRALKNLMDAIARPHGIIIVCGPTGSGKTTTLYSVLNIVSSIKVNVVTIEDPVEYQIAGINQVQVNNQAGLTFATALRSFLRQDPNIIMVGEIRDSETADLAINASLTGHLVFSTLHTNDAAGVPPRMLDLGAEPFLLVSSLTAVIGQRVLRRVCQNCVQYVDMPKEVETDFKETLGPIFDMLVERYKKDGNGIKIPKPVGCDKCNNSGYFGRIAIYEVMPMTEKISKLVLERASAQAIQKQAVEEGMLTMKQDGYVKVAEGISTIDEVLRVAQY